MRKKSQNWASISIIGKSIEHAARTCKDILRSNTGLINSGKYWLSPQQYDDTAFVGYCNMDDVDGGWTLAYSFEVMGRHNSSNIDSGSSQSRIRISPVPTWAKHSNDDDDVTRSKRPPKCKNWCCLDVINTINLLVITG